MSERGHIPNEVVRAVLVEAGHRCAIPTCRATTTEVAHVEPWAQSKDDSFENLIALCPNCHTRYDQKREIDRLALKMYKRNLGLLNNRYGDVERRLFTELARTGERVFMLGAGGDILVANAVRDGLFEDKKVGGIEMGISGSNGFQRNFPLSFTFWVTDAGVEFIRRYAAGESIDGLPGR